jgi:hypothetical protein
MLIGLVVPYVDLFWLVLKNILKVKTFWLIFHHEQMSIAMWYALLLTAAILAILKEQPYCTKVYTTSK